VAEAPETLTLARHRDLRGRERDPWVRWAFLLLLTAVAVAGLLNVFGQRPQTTRSSSPAASLKVYSPSHVRGGLLFMARFHVFARETLRNATLVLDPGWLESMTVNTIEPSPVNEHSRNGRLVLEYGKVPAGRTLLAFMEFQVNPTNVGRRAQDVDLYDGDRLLVHVDRTITVFP
jgi:hypothetical protein